MKNIFLFVTILFIFSCHKMDKLYFDYDEIEYYKSEIEDDYVLQELKNSKDSLKHEIILNNYPKNISDTNFVNELENFGFKKSKISPNKFDRIDKIFKEKSSKNLYASACIYIYRDILIFKKKSKIIGIAKICFDCDSNVIVGTSKNTSNFGMNEDYQKLNKILCE